MPVNWEEARDWVTAGGLAPLVVSCPRCGRTGTVAADGRGEYTIEWRDPTHGWTWRDAGVTSAELASPDFGCGYDRRADKGFVGGAPMGTTPPPRKR